VGFAIRSLPIKAIVQFFIADNLLSVFVAYEVVLLSAATSSWQTRVVDISFRPIRRYKIPLLPASVSKYHELRLFTSGMGVVLVVRFGVRT